MSAVAVETPWMNVKEVMGYARIGRSEVLDALAKEELRGYQRRANGQWRVHRDDVDAWLRGEGPAAAPAPVTSRRSA